MATVFNVFTFVFRISAATVMVYLLVLIIIKIYSTFFAKIKKVSATVIDKHVSKYDKFESRGITRKTTDCSVTFLCGKKEKNFFTTKWLYSSVEKGDTGVLKYRGSRFISFD